MTVDIITTPFNVWRYSKKPVPPSPWLENDISTKRECPAIIGKVYEGTPGALMFIANASLEKDNTTISNRLKFCPNTLSVGIINPGETRYYHLDEITIDSMPSVINDNIDLLADVFSTSGLGMTILQETEEKPAISISSAIPDPNVDVNSYIFGALANVVGATAIAASLDQQNILRGDGLNSPLVSTKVTSIFNSTASYYFQVEGDHRIMTREAFDTEEITDRAVSPVINAENILKFLEKNH
jgi:hypothetical protein